MDLFVAACALVMLFPLLLCIAIVVRLSSPGPILYRGKRVGLHGKRFRMLKFRTMIVGADELGGTSTGRDDPRVTSIGRVLRKYKLDELPQLINVLRGEMSLVGPRPEVEEYAAAYEGEELLILTVRPGITDYASIEFRNLADVLGDQDVDRRFAESVLPKKNELRIRYVKERGFVTDLRIMAETLWAIFGK